MRRLNIFVMMIVFLFCNGCQIIGIIGTPTASERKIPAEYKLAKRKKGKILVLVNQPGWLNADTNLQLYVTKAVNQKLSKKAKINKKFLVSYGVLSKMRSKRRDFALLTPVQAGATLDVQTVLFVVIEDYKLYELPGSNYYKGSLIATAWLFDVAAGQRLWPDSDKGKSVRVRVDMELGGKTVAINRLAGAAAYCIVRYFYNCSSNRFRIADEMVDASWQG